MKARTALYRHFNSSGDLLYVGISACAMKRIAEHKNSSWVLDIARIELQYFEERGAAREAEKQAIKSEMPLFNKMDKPPPISEAEALFERVYNDEDFGDQAIYFQTFEVYLAFIKEYKKYARRRDKQKNLMLV